MKSSRQYRCLIYISIILSLILSQTDALAISDYGNVNAQEYGDAVYHYLDVLIPEVLGYNYNHAGIFSGIDVSDIEQVIESTGSSEFSVKRNSFWDSFESWGSQYYGAYTVSNVVGTFPFSERKTIIQTALNLSYYNLGYPWLAHDALTYYGSTFDGSIFDIKEIRCDGVVEYAYEANGWIVWWNTGDSKWNIATDDGVESHNDMPDATVEPGTELSPWAQRGSPPNTGPVLSHPHADNTYMTRASVIDLPTYEVSSWLDNDHVVVEVKAKDITSGIHKIGYRLPGGSGWTYSRNVQHPSSDTYTQQYNVYSEGYFYYWAQDNGGNQPQYSEGIYVYMPPIKAINPSPTNGATNCSISTDTSWSNGGGATSYDVYFGTDSTPDSGEFKGNQGGTTYDPGTLAYSTTYYWRIDAKNSAGTTTGDVWSFTTQNPIQYTLSASVVGGNGSVSPTSGTYDAGTVVPLTATPNAGYQVKAWNGTDDDSSKSISNTVTMNDNKNVTVEFELIQNNHTPVLETIGNKSVSENSLLSFTVSATDADGDTLTYSAQNLPSGATFVGQTFSWTPSYTQAGTYSVTFRASDGKSQDSETITITVSNTNRAPVLATIGNKSVNENSTLSFSISATDADGDTITYSAPDLPTGAAFAGRTFTWTPGYTQAGNYQVTFIANDGQAQDSKTITITVNNANQAPCPKSDWQQIGLRKRPFSFQRKCNRARWRYNNLFGYRFAQQRHLHQPKLQLDTEPKSGWHLRGYLYRKRRP
ncbi:MAG: putative Ig domain-containing protein, partial [Sedimentisphaerales bacterium]|nr:putative Ig domain-containing protein [Sedimentisphaerales bacterium]